MSGQPQQDSAQPGMLLHRRTYAVDAYEMGPEHFRLVGKVCDQVPGRLYPPGDDSTFSLHDMTIVVDVDAADLTITAIHPAMEVAAQLTCGDILPEYRSLEGASFTRGFSSRVRQDFGGPRGCTHLNALLQAMAPVAIQARSAMGAGSLSDNETDFVAEQTRMVANTCHVWSADGPYVARLEAGENMLPLPIRRHKKS